MRISSAIAFSSLALLLSGCAGAPVMTPSSTGSVPGTALRGKVHGGQSPIVGAHVYLYAVNDTGYAGPGIAASASNASISLLNSSGSNTTEDGNGNYYVTTDANGEFKITNDYTCSAATPDLYLLAVGGSPGGTGTSNSAATLTAALGPCTIANFTSLIIVVNEVSTIVSSYAFAGFATDPTHVSSSGSALALQGLQNAAYNVLNMETIYTGAANATTRDGNGTVPVSEINTLANTLAACVNSTGPTTTQCVQLFCNATGGISGIQATDTATAAIYIAHNPGEAATNSCFTGNLYGLQAGVSAPFLPDLSKNPNDFTIAISYTGGGLDYPYGVAIDASGNVWVTDYNTAANSLSEFSPAEGPLSPSTGDTGGGLTAPFGIAIDSSGNVWVTNSNGANSISEFSSTGMAISLSSGDTGGGLNIPEGIAIDKSGNVWVANVGNNSISEFNSGGSAVSGTSGDTLGGLEEPSRIAIDTSRDIWVLNPAIISEFNSSTGTPLSMTGYSGGGLGGAEGIAIDASGNVWMTNYSTNTLSEFTPSSSTWDSPFSGELYSYGLNYPTAIAIDGAGDVWVVNSGNNSISEFSSSSAPSGVAISGPFGYIGGAGGVLAGPGFLAIDGSGNVWVPNIANNTLVEFVGAAAPVVTPIVANLLTPYGSHAVNLP
ncbi:MAG: NHL repeat-containing protein [Terracidiphilus sp.]